jgi:uncharacterized protein YukE
MRKGFTKKDQEVLERKCESAESALDMVIEQLREKLESAQEWMEERSEVWWEGDSAQEFEDWVNELEFKIDELENLKDEINFESMEDIL